MTRVSAARAALPTLNILIEVKRAILKPNSVVSGGIALQKLFSSRDVEKSPASGGVTLDLGAPSHGESAVVVEK